MATTTPLIWVPDGATAEKIAILTSAFTAVNEWDNEARTFTNRQVVDGTTGNPVWVADGLMRLGYDGAISPVKLRISAASRPTTQPSTALLSALAGGASPVRSVGGVGDLRKPPSTGGERRQS